MYKTIIKDCDGIPRFKRVRVFVHDLISGSTEFMDMNSIAKRFPNLTMNEVKEASRYFEENRDEIYQAIQDEIPF